MKWKRGLLVPLVPLVPVFQSGTGGTSGTAETNNDLGRSESEEAVIGNISPLKRYLTGISVSDKTIYTINPISLFLATIYKLTN